MTRSESARLRASVTNAIRKEKRRLSRKIVKIRLFKRECPRSVKGCLKILGIIQKWKRHFWFAHDPSFDWLLFDAHKLWKQGMKKCKGDTERAYLLNAAWDRVERIFADHGYTL